MHEKGQTENLKIHSKPTSLKIVLWFLYLVSFLRSLRSLRNDKKDRESLIKVHVRAYLQFNEKIRPGLDKFNGPSTLICTCTAIGDSRVIFYTDILDIEF